MRILRFIDRATKTLSGTIVAVVGVLVLGVCVVVFGSAVGVDLLNLVVAGWGGLATLVIWRNVTSPEVAQVDDCSDCSCHELTHRVDRLDHHLSSSSGYTNITCLWD